MNTGPSAEAVNRLRRNKQRREKLPLQQRLDALPFDGEWHLLELGTDGYAHITSTSSRINSGQHGKNLEAAYDVLVRNEKARLWVRRTSTTCPTCGREGYGQKAG